MLGLLIVIHLVSTLLMVGLIWFVQVVHYPLFHSVGSERFATYEREHQQRTSRLVVPIMVIEATTAGLLPFLVKPPQLPAALVGLGLLVLIWVSTFTLQVPLHRRLAEAYEESAARRLVTTNWVRTASWSGRGLTALYLAIGVR